MRISDWSSDVCSSDLALLAAQLQPARPVPLGAAGSRWLVGPFGRRLDREAAASVLPCQAEGPLDDERLVAVAAERPWRFRRRQDFAVRAGCRACHAKPEKRRPQQRQDPPGGGRTAVASPRIWHHHPKGRAARWHARPPGAVAATN